jgi:hypothetical protein
MTSYQVEAFPIGAQFYAIGAGQGEGVLTNPTAPKVSITDVNGVAVAGSPFVMIALAVPIVGLRTYSWTAGAPGNYIYLCYDSQDPTPTITHSQGTIKVEFNDFDALDGEIDTLTTNLATAQADLTTIKGYTDSLEGSFTTALADLATIKGYTDSVEGTLATLLGYGAPPSANAIADQVWDEVASGHVTAGSFGGIVSRVKGPGSGATQVTKDTGGSNTLRPEVSGVAQTGVAIDAFLTSDYGSGNTTDAYRKGRAVSDASGDFKLMLDTGAYTLLYYRLRSGATSGLSSTTTTLTVS